VVFSSLAGALRDVIARWVPPTVPTLVVSMSSAVTLAVVGTGWAVIDGWQPMTHRGIALVLGSSLLLACGYQLLMIALRSGAAFAVLGAFRYASVLWAIAIGYVLWGDVPNLLAVAGIVVIVGAGLYVLHASVIAQSRPDSRVPRPRRRCRRSACRARAWPGSGRSRCGRRGRRVDSPRRRRTSRSARCALELRAIHRLRILVQVSATSEAVAWLPSPVG